MSEIRILLDMDGVLCDFVGGACRIHGWTREALEQAWPVGTYDIMEPMSLTLDQFWAPINAAGKNFWLELGALPWMEEIQRLVKSVTDDWFIVSAPAFDPSCYSGKAGWLKYMARDYTFNRFLLTLHKHILAKPNVILIDDNEENVTQFTRAGGAGILFPAYGNRLHSYATEVAGDDRLEYVSLRLNNLLKELH